MSEESEELRVSSRGRVTLPKRLREEVDSPSHFIAETDGETITLIPAQIEPRVGE